MSAQVEEVSASARSLEEMAQALQEVVAQFKLGQSREQREPSNPVKTGAGQAPSNGNGKAGSLLTAQYAKLH